MTQSGHHQVANAAAAAALAVARGLSMGGRGARAIVTIVTVIGLIVAVINMFTGYFWGGIIQAIIDLIILGLLGRNHAAVVQILGSTFVAITMLLFIGTSVCLILPSSDGSA